MTVLTSIAWAGLAVSISVALYAYVLYPAALWALAVFRKPRPLLEGDLDHWPTVSISVPVFNEEKKIEGLIKSLLALDYPKDRLQILIVSDASTDRTEGIVESYEDQGVELLKLTERCGKTYAEGAAAPHLRGDIVVNTDATIRIAPGALKPLISALADPSVGLASGRDVSVGAADEEGNIGEKGYVGYEMAIRGLETRVFGIVGASGCLYAIRTSLHSQELPASLSRDFAAALNTRENGFRAVSVPDAVCSVPRAGSLKREYRRKVRTITRGMGTLAHKRALLNPFRYGLFSWMLFSHKVCRWALPWFAVLGALSLFLLAFQHSWALGPSAGLLLLLALAALGWVTDGGKRSRKVFSLPGFILLGNLAAMHAFLRHLKGVQQAVWEPTRRTTP